MTNEPGRSIAILAVTVAVVALAVVMFAGALRAI
jgi:hypothetical protein